MGFLNKLFGRRKNRADTPAFSKQSQREPTEPSLEQFKQKLWDASPKSRCGVCGKDLRGPSGGLVMGSGEEGFLEMILEGVRYICPSCGFISCFECCTDLKNKQYKAICRRCKAEMQTG